MSSSRRGSVQSTPTRGSTRRAAPTQQRPGSMAQSATRTAGRTVSKAAHTGLATVAGLWRYIVQPLLGWLFGLFRGVTGLQASITGCLAMAALAIALSGVATLGVLKITRDYTLVKADITRQLDFDYSGPVAVATVHLHEPPMQPSFMKQLSMVLGYGAPQVSQQEYLASYTKQQAGGMAAGHIPNSVYHPASALPKGALAVEDEPRPLAPGQPVSAWLTLDLPTDYMDLFQVVLELQTQNGARSLMKVTRAYMPPRTSLLAQLIRHSVMLPWQIMGLGSPTQRVRIKLVDRYVEQAGSPLVQARVMLSSRNGSIGPLPPPAVYRGILEVKLKLGMARWLLHLLRPSWAFTMVLGSIAATTTVVFGAIALLLSLVTFFLHRLSAAGAPRAAPAAAPAGPVLDQQTARYLTLLLDKAQPAPTRMQAARMLQYTDAGGSEASDELHNEHQASLDRELQYSDDEEQVSEAQMWASESPALSQAGREHLSSLRRNSQGDDQQQQQQQQPRTPHSGAGTPKAGIPRPSAARRAAAADSDGAATPKHRASSSKKSKAKPSEAAAAAGEKQQAPADTVADTESAGDQMHDSDVAIQTRPRSRTNMAADEGLPQSGQHVKGQPVAEPAASGEGDVSKLFASIQRDVYEQPESQHMQSEEEIADAILKTGSVPRTGLFASLESEVRRRPTRAAAQQDVI